MEGITSHDFRDFDDLMIKANDYQIMEMFKKLQKNIAVRQQRGLGEYGK